MTAMTMPRPGEPMPDLYQLLGVARGAPAGEIAQAYRRKARAAHPDSRPGDADAPARFRVLAGAYQVLSDPARRAAYDRALRPERPAHASPARTAPAAGATAAQMHPLWLADVSRPAGRTPAAPGPPLWAGPVRVEPAAAAPAPTARRDEDARLALIAELVSRYLGASWGQPW